MPPIPDDHWAALLPEIERIARMVAIKRNASPTVRDALFSKAAGHVFEASISFSPNQGRFAAWCQRVLNNLCVDLIRREAASRRRFDRYRDDMEHLQGTAERTSGNRTSAEEDDETDEQPLLPMSPEQLRADLVDLFERRLAPDRRLLVIAYLGGIDACGEGVVARWCREAGFTQPVDFRTIASLPKTKRKKALANALGLKLDTVRTQIYRALQSLGGDGVEGGRS